MKSKKLLYAFAGLVFVGGLAFAFSSTEFFKGRLSAVTDFSETLGSRSDVELGVVEDSYALTDRPADANLTFSLEILNGEPKRVTGNAVQIEATAYSLNSEGTLVEQGTALESINSGFIFDENLDSSATESVTLNFTKSTQDLDLSSVDITVTYPDVLVEDSTGVLDTEFFEVTYEAPLGTVEVDLNFEFDEDSIEFMLDGEEMLLSFDLCSADELDAAYVGEYIANSVGMHIDYEINGGTLIQADENFDITSFLDGESFVDSCMNIPIPFDWTVLDLDDSVSLYLHMSYPENIELDLDAMTVTTNDVPAYENSIRFTNASGYSAEIAALVDEMEGGVNIEMLSANIEDLSLYAEFSVEGDEATTYDFYLTAVIGDETTNSANSFSGGQSMNGLVFGDLSSLFSLDPSILDEEGVTMTVSLDSSDNVEESKEDDNEIVIPVPTETLEQLIDESAEEEEEDVYDYEAVAREILYEGYGLEKEEAEERMMQLVEEAVDRQTEEEKFLIALGELAEDILAEREESADVMTEEEVEAILEEMAREYEDLKGVEELMEKLKEDVLSEDEDWDEARLREEAKRQFEELNELSGDAGADTDEEDSLLTEEEVDGILEEVAREYQDREALEEAKKELKNEVLSELKEWDEARLREEAQQRFERLESKASDEEEAEKVDYDAIAAEVLDGYDGDAIPVDELVKEAQNVGTSEDEFRRELEERLKDALAAEEEATADETSPSTKTDVDSGVDADTDAAIDVALDSVDLGTTKPGLRSDEKEALEEVLEEAIAEGSLDQSDIDDVVEDFESETDEDDNLSEMLAALEAAIAAANSAASSASSAASAAQSAASSASSSGSSSGGSKDVVVNIDLGDYVSGSTSSSSTTETTTETVATTESASTSPFSDVEAGTWYGDAMIALNEEGIMEGSNGKAYPWEYGNRAELVVLVMRAFYDESVLSKMNFDHEFEDVPSTKWYAMYLSAAVEFDILEAKDEFRPSESMTRAEFVTVLVRAANELCTTCDANFSDVSQKDWYYRAVATALSADLVSGYEDGSFKPNAKINRAQVASILYKALQAGWLD